MRGCAACAASSLTSRPRLSSRRTRSFCAAAWCCRPWTACAWSAQASTWTMRTRRRALRATPATSSACNGSFRRRRNRSPSRAVSRSAPGRRTACRWSASWPKASTAPWRTVRGAFYGRPWRPRCSPASWKASRCLSKERCSTRWTPPGSRGARSAGSDNMIRFDRLPGEARMGRKPRPAKRKTRVGGVDRDEMLRAAFDQAAVGMTLVSLDLRYLRVNDKFCEIVGYSRDELLSMGLRDTGEIPGHEAREKELLRKDGSRVWVAVATSLARGKSGEPRYFISVVQDISEAKRATAALRESEERFRQLAHHDALTSLPNRAVFYDRMQHTLALAKRNSWTVGVMLVDLDRFKTVNDTLGHAVGDKLLRQVAERLSKSVRTSDTVARLGGDEFAVVLNNLSAPEDAAVVGQKIVAAFQAPFQVEGHSLLSTLSIGAALYPNDSTDQETLLKNADAAMYRSKEAGRNCFRMFSAAGWPDSRP